MSILSTDLMRGAAPRQLGPQRGLGRLRCRRDGGDLANLAVPVAEARLSTDSARRWWGWSRRRRGYRPPVGRVRRHQVSSNSRSQASISERRKLRRRRGCREARAQPWGDRGSSGSARRGGQPAPMWSAPAQGREWGVRVRFMHGRCATRTEGCRAVSSAHLSGNEESRCTSLGGRLLAEFYMLSFLFRGGRTPADLRFW